MLLGMSRSVFSHLGIAILAFGAGLGIAALYFDSQQQSLLQTFHSLRRTEGEFSLIHPLIAYETPEATTFDEYQQLKSRIKRLIDAEVQKGGVSEVSVYYRNQETGAWIGINEEAYYYPASLLKVPVMIAYLKLAESNPDLLEKHIKYRPITGGDPFEAESGLESGKTYRVKELIEHMIIDSDNGATYTLIDAIDSRTLNAVYSDLGIVQPDQDTSTYQISTKTYALFFRVLYNATYLSPRYSQMALEILTRASYTDGLTDGVPENTPVAHKFGEHVVSRNRTDAEGVELHDCGIVYFPSQT